MPGKRSRNAAIAVGPISSLLDAINLQLLRELQEHPRQTIATLARRIGMSAPAVAERIQRLQEAGVIAGYCHRITGEDCFLLKVHAAAVDQLEAILDRFLALGQTTTSIVQSTPVPLRPLPLPAEE